MKTSLLKPVICFALLGVLASCTNSAPGGKDGKISPAAQKAVGTFEAVREQNYDYAKGEFPQIDLEVPSDCNLSAPNAFDKKLARGQRFVQQVQSTDQERTIGSKTSLTIEEVRPNHVVKRAVVSDIIDTKADFEIPSSFTQLITCDANATSPTGFSCAVKWLDWNEPKVSESTYCYGESLDGRGMQAKGTVAIGKYTMSNGVTVRAKKMEESEKVKIICRRQDGKEQELGTGVRYRVNITSHDILSSHPGRCREQQYLFSYVTLTKADGVVVDSETTETLEAPVH